MVSFGLLQFLGCRGLRTVCTLASDGYGEWLGSGAAACCCRSVGFDCPAIVAEEVFVGVRGVGWCGGAHALLDGWPQV